MRVSSRPTIIQGGMGVAVSSWPLARAVAVAGQLGVVSGTALDIVVARRLQDGDPGGHLRRALAAFPVPEIAERVATRYFRPEGRGSGNRYAPVPPLTLPPTRRAQELTVVAHFVEVFLAKEGHDGLIGINYLEKVQLALPYGILGAMLAGVDYVMVGAGLPRQVPALLNAFAALQPASIDIDVAGSAEPHRLTVDPAHWSPGSAPLHRPAFVAIISSDILAGYLARDESTRPEGFVVEGPSAGGHNAPPRGRLTLDDEGEPVYGARDVANLERMVALGLPFWLAGSYGTPERLLEALAAGAAGIQAGTVFALCEQSGLTPGLRVAALAGLRSERLLVRTDVAASPTGFPFKVAQLPTATGTLRHRLCDVGVLRAPYARADNSVGYRCPAEPERDFVRKGGTLDQTLDRACLCNGLLADVGLAQTRRNGYVEAPMLTLGADLQGARRLLAEHPDGWTAADVVTWLSPSSVTSAR